MYRLFTPVLLCAALVAQETSAQPTIAANRFVPADSFLVARMGAPAKWKKQFAKTQVAKLMTANTLAPLITQATAAFDAALGQLRQSGEFDADLLEKLLGEYRDICFSMQVDWDDIGPAMEENRPPAFSMVFSLSPDGSFDLGALAAGIQKLVEKEDENRRPMRDLTVGDLRLQVTVPDNDEPQACVPLMVDGHLVMLLGSDLDKNAMRLLGSEDRFAGELPHRPFHVHARIDRMMAALLEAIENQLDATGAVPFEVGPLVQKLGLTSMETLTMSLDAEDKHMSTEMRLTLGQGELGLLAMVMVEQAPKLLRLVPTAAEYLGNVHFDINALYKTITGVWNDLGDAVPMTVADAEAAFTEAMKVRLAEDLLQHIGTEMLTLQDTDLSAMADEDAEDNPLAALGGSCMVFSLRNGKAFGESLETMLRARGMHASRKSEDYADTKVYQLRVAGLVELEYTVTDDLLLIALGKGEAPRRNLRGVLDARKRTDGDAGLPVALAKHLAALPEGWNGIGVTPIARLLDSWSGLFGAMEATGRMPEDMTEMIEAMQGLAGDMERLGIENMVSTSYCKGRSLEYRMRW